MSETVIREGEPIATLINVFEVEPAKQQELIDVLNEGTEKAFRSRPGFISVNILASLDRTKVINLAQWRSPEDVQATMADPEVQAWVRRSADLAVPSATVYRVVSVHHA
jgi:quinol monooxygenase YgiN